MWGNCTTIKMPSVFVSLESNIIKKNSQIGPFRDLNPEMSVISDLSQLLNSITNEHEQSKVHRYCWVLRKKNQFHFQTSTQTSLPAPNYKISFRDLYLAFTTQLKIVQVLPKRRGKKIVGSFPRICPTGINMEKHFCNVMNTSVSIIMLFLYIESASVQKKIALAYQRVLLHQLSYHTYYYITKYFQENPDR